MDLDSFTLAASLTDLEKEPLARDDADAIEFRIDLASAPRTALREYSGSLPVIATNRMTSEGGEAPDTPDRLELLSFALEQPAVTAIDLELRALEQSRDAQNVADAARDNGVTVIVSSHDFDETPPLREMKRRVDASYQFGEIAKLSVTPADYGDVLEVLELTWNYSARDQGVATMCMGEIGRHSRVLAPVYGSKIGYAPVSTADATAPGQFDLKTLRRLITELSPTPD